MKITKQDFEKLSKKKQIELRERMDKIKNEDFHSFGLIYIWWFIFVFAFFILILPLYKLAFSSEIVLPMFKIFMGVLYFFKLVIMVGFTCDILRILNYFRRKDKLRREYFKQKIEVINGR